LYLAIFKITLMLLTRCLLLLHLGLLLPCGPLSLPAGPAILTLTPRLHLPPIYYSLLATKLCRLVLKGLQQLLRGLHLLLPWQPPLLPGAALMLWLLLNQCADELRLVVFVAWLAARWR